MNEDNLYVCMICECAGSNGIHILSQFICSDCEEEIVNTSVEDDLYIYFVERMRAVWLDLLELETDRPPGSSFS